MKTILAFYGSLRKGPSRLVLHFGGIITFGLLGWLIVIGTGAANHVDSIDEGCASGGSVQLPSTKLIIEHNSTDQDTGVHGLFDGEDWTRLTVSDPSRQQILDVEPMRQLGTQSISGIFFESAEPPNDEVPIEELFERFPEGMYRVGGCSADGKRLRGSAVFTHDIPAGPQILYPQSGDVVPAKGLVVSWGHVNTTIDERPITRTGYQVIITKDVADDPNGFSRPTFDVHVLPTVTSLTVPDEFLEPSTNYELEVLVLEVSGNQTISSLFFETE